MKNSLSYREFKDELLLHFAIHVQAATDVQADPESAAALIHERFQRSWIASATKELADAGYIKGITDLSGTGSYALTGYGLERAERIAHNVGADLHEMIADSDPYALVEDGGSAMTDDRGNRLVVSSPESDRADAANIIKIDPLSQAFRELDEEMSSVIRELRGSNQLAADGGAETSQRLAELEAGRILMSAEQADKSLVRRVLLPALQWLLKKVVDESAKTGIQKLIAIISAYF